MKHTPVYSYALKYDIESLEFGFGWPWHFYIYENGLIAGHGLGLTQDEAVQDAWDEFWKYPPETLRCQMCGKVHGGGNG
jgi:hypothetical protein